MTCLFRKPAAIQRDPVEEMPPGKVVSSIQLVGPQAVDAALCLDELIQRASKLMLFKSFRNKVPFQRYMGTRSLSPLGEVAVIGHPLAIHETIAVVEDLASVLPQIFQVKLTLSSRVIEPADLLCCEKCHKEYHSKLDLLLRRGFKRSHLTRWRPSLSSAFWMVRREDTGSDVSKKNRGA